MITVKEQVKWIIDEMPDDVSFDEIIKELAFKMMIERGIADSDHHRVISDAQMEADFTACQPHHLALIDYDEKEVEADLQRLTRRRHTC